MKEAMKLAMDAKIHKAGMNPIMQGPCYLMHPNALQAVIDVALREALAEQPEQQEPFALYFETYSYEGQKSTWFVACPCDGKLNGKPGIPLYTSPPAQRTWVGLTDEEVDEVDGWTPEIHTVIRAIEAKLKEKNT